MHLEAVLFFSRGSVMDTLTLLVSLIPHRRHTWQWRRDPRYYIHSSQWVCVHRGPSAMFLNWHIGEESPSWYLSRQPIIIAHLCLLIVWSFPAVQAQVGGLWFQAQGGLSWPWDTREVQPRPHSSGMLWLLIRLSMARSLGIGPSKAFYDWAPEPRARRCRIAFNSCGSSKAQDQRFKKKKKSDWWRTFHAGIQGIWQISILNPGRSINNCMKANTFIIFCVEMNWFDLSIEYSHNISQICVKSRQNLFSFILIQVS